MTAVVEEMAAMEPVDIDELESIVMPTPASADGAAMPPETPAHARSAGGVPPEDAAYARDDEAFNAAQESSSGFSMF